ncbi:MAG: sarcosine oxidase subunit gamma [Mesorhizobium sp.]|uniref:sarcosine oxidase subunit gamma family protein n=1 Tax=unclassified Mesorhizobium TaxID=325217 RepID=UPI000FE42439|nr:MULTISPECIES: sarcosine oxidase subunit gamma family protein [unclassified Mesorhizobium]RWI34139.1 MAG: sarcosine oxidase subunit gamma [Mesorhizobium sp.]RWI63202.1 MAG: sarcosine oxidase subunit gamma [Mesorhizobium sp.]RWI82482.1 MAG: sarcosine oxidase subunit gamma [Mesorhizobium sp.]RWJ43915.1 MAG: sarcosine oxidase subunit gamma [Mesorhizobium sp.]RWJ57422.1 MAG: sarcosine oxidase subunit gamma [Mesorhizobium sp.]
MSDSELIHRPAIGSAAVRGSDAFAIRAMPEGTLIHILGRPGGEDLTEMLRHLFGDEANTVRPAGPGQWLLVRDEATSHVDLQAKFGKLAPHIFAVDQSHGRVRIEVTGYAVQSLLAKGMAIDLDSMDVGHSSMALMGHFSVHITRVASDHFELIVLRSFGQSLWDEIAYLSADL